MELHENLYQLGLTFGREVFDDADGLRAALDDFLDEGAASTGDINLLVDAVRLGSFRWMLSTIDSGAEPSRAIESAGDLLARDRGSADVAGSRWACAVLGFAVGKVTDTDVRRYRTQGPPLPPQPQPPATSPAPPPPMSPTMMPPPAAPGTQLAGQPVPPAPVPSAVGFSAPPPTGSSYPPPPAWSSQPNVGQQPPTKKKGLLPLLVVAGVVVIIVGVVFAVLKLTGGDDDPKADTTDPKSDESSEGSDEPTDLALDFASINERYTGLGSRVTTGQSDCVAGELLSGQSEALACTFPQGTLELTTYETQEELDAARQREVNTEIGGRYAKDSTGVVFSFAPEGAVPTLYWDNEGALQSGFYEASSADVGVDALATVFESTGAQVKYPKGLTSPELIDFADLWVRPNQCDRIQTLSSGELEESLCKARKQISVYVAQMATKADLIAYRQIRLRDSRQDGLILSPPDWMYGTGPVEGRLADSYAEGDRVLRYWDLTECLCYMEAYYPTNDLDALTDWWVDPRPQG